MDSGRARDRERRIGCSGLMVVRLEQTSPAAAVLPRSGSTQNRSDPKAMLIPGIHVVRLFRCLSVPHIFCIRPRFAHERSVSAQVVLRKTFVYFFSYSRFHSQP